MMTELTSTRIKSTANWILSKSYLIRNWRNHSFIFKSISQPLKKIRLSKIRFNIWNQLRRCSANKLKIYKMTNRIRIIVLLTRKDNLFFTSSLCRQAIIDWAANRFSQMGKMTGWIMIIWENNQLTVNNFSI